MEPPASVALPAPTEQERLTDIIRRHSANREDVRRVALEGLDLTRARRLLDLGCGPGFMARGLQGRSAPGATILGIDREPGNRVPFLAAATAGGCRGSFLCRALHTHLDFPARTFDLVTAAYSLHLFPGVIAEVARVLQPGGHFVAIAPGEAACTSLLWARGVPPERSVLRTLLRAFSAENGAGLLREHFTAVERRPFANTLVFDAGDTADFAALVRHRAPQLGLAGSAPPSPEELDGWARASLRAAGTFSLECDAAVFVCTGPKP
jgi:SAM-dependent methyltransferase